MTKGYWPHCCSQCWADYQAASNTSEVVVYDPFSGNTIDSSLSLPGRIASLRWIRSTLLGVLGTTFVMVVTFYFGSSSSSKSKDAVIAAQVAPPVPPAAPLPVPLPVEVVPHA